MNHLVEGNVKSFIASKLQHSHQIRVAYYNTVINIGLLIGFAVVIGVFLWYSYKGRPTPEKLKEREEYTKQLILDAVRNQKLENMRNQQTLITGLPHWDTEYAYAPL